MQISGLELTLRRIDQIESNFSQIFNRENLDSTFSNVLDNAIEKKPGSATNNNSTGTIEAGETVTKSLLGIDSISISEIDNLVSKYSQENSLEPSLVKAVIRAESAFNPTAKSHMGAMGLMQLMPATAKNMGVENPFDPEENISGGTKYLKNLLDRYDGNKELAIAAYNAGPNAVNKHGGIPPYNETQNYVQKVIEFQKQYSGQYTN